MDVIGHESPRLAAGTAAFDRMHCHRNRIRSAPESSRVIFVEENGEGPGVRLRKARE